MMAWRWTLFVALVTMLMTAGAVDALPTFDDAPLTQRAWLFFSGLFDASWPCSDWAATNFSPDATWHHPLAPGGVNGTTQLADWCQETRDGYLPNASYLPTAQLPLWTHSGLAYAAIPYVWSAVDATNSSVLVTNWGTVTLAVDPSTTLISFGVETWTFHQWKD